MDIHSDLELIKAVAIKKAQDHNCNYNIILLNPNSKGEFNVEYGSTYEFVADSHLQKDADNVVLLHRTDDLIKEMKSPKIGVVGMGLASHLEITTMQGSASAPVVVEDSKTNPFETPQPFILTNPYAGLINVDHDVYPAKRSGGSNFTPKKKKRKK